ncbi:MAG: tRNA (guanosine(46)-N7)-methyltransferase TrmB [Alphaproteobacteria bacterium]|nr:tRNA (guanosine(46)-N7)-methyltransferase TrmB [Alphaproteobacteria bacterium]
MNEDIGPVLRRVYGRRRGKPLNAARQQLMDRLLPRLLLPVEEGDANLDPRMWFGPGVRQVWFEIGFGKGEHLAWQAQNHPDVGIIGCEPYETGVAGLLSEVSARNLQNVRIWTDDAALLLAALRPGSISRAFLLFPDPWPKARHHKRRFVSPDRLDILSRALADGAEFRAATDHEDYGEWILRHMADRDDFEWLAERPGDWRGRTTDWPQTRYEAKALARGAKPLYLRYRRGARGAGPAGGD